MLKYVSQISSIIVALLFVFTINFKSFITINYFVNQTEIIELFCINKEKPKLKCDGKCHLATQLIEVEKNTSDNPFSSSPLMYELDITPSISSNEINFTPNIHNMNKMHYSNNASNICAGYASFSFQPPKA